MIETCNMRCTWHWGPLKRNGASLSVTEGTPLERTPSFYRENAKHKAEEHDHHFSRIEIASFKMPFTQQFYSRLPRRKISSILHHNSVRFDNNSAIPKCRAGEVIGYVLCPVEKLNLYCKIVSKILNEA